MDEIPIQQLLEESDIVPPPFYLHSASQAARDVLGLVLVHGETAGMIVESEAYLGGDDLAAHSARGLTARTAVIFGPPGRAYVYFVYGMYDCLNLVVEPEGSPGCVLVRALQPVSGLNLMRQRRPKVKKVEALASGPGRLTLAMNVGRELNGSSLVDGPLTLRRWRNAPSVEVAVTPRIGISKSADRLLRFVVRNNRFTSRLVY